MLRPPGFINTFSLFEGKESRWKDIPNLSCVPKKSETGGSGEIMRFRYHIPRSACVDFPQNKFPVSAYAALIDDVSTWSIIGDRANKSMRSGVSTHLSVHLGQGGLEGIGRNPGDAVDFEVEVIRIGRTMGFAHVNVHDVNSGATICTGRHAKFLPMGALFETLFSENVLPLTKAYARYLERDVDPPLTANEVEKLHDVVKFSNLSTSNESAEIKVKAHHCNPMGSLHGGCQAVFAEQMGRPAAKLILNKDFPTLKSINMTYFSSETKAAALSVNPILVSKNDLKSSVMFRKVTDGRPISEAVLDWC